jgi:FkbM family methyltransferase
MLRIIRRNKIINSIFRNILRWLKNNVVNFLNKIINRWPTSGVIECKFSDSFFLLYNKCDDGLTDIFYYDKKYQEVNDLKLFALLSEKSATIFDIGANIGLFSILSSKKNNDSEIYAFEPYVTNFNRLCVNLKLNNCLNVYAEQIAIGDTNGEIQITVPEGDFITDVSSVNENFSKKIYPNLNWKKQLVPLESIDSFKNRKKLKINLIKCDVESFEMNVFKGMKKTLMEDKPTILLECFLDKERELFFNNILKEFKYYVYMVFPDSLVYLNNGFEKNNEGLNYIMSPITPVNNVIWFREISKNPEKIIHSPKK